MAITLADAALNTQDAYDTTVINEFRKASALLDILQWEDAVNPAGGGATLTYSYRRQENQRRAQFRPLNTEYEPEHVTTKKISVDLAELGGSYELDRRIAYLGPAATNEIALQTANVIQATTAKFTDAVINGDTAVDAAGFDGLDKALTGSTTESTEGFDLSQPITQDNAFNAIDAIDELTSVLDGPVTALVCNRVMFNKLRAAGRRANMHVISPVAGLTQNNGIDVHRELFGSAVLIDAGTKDGTNDPVIPIEADGTTSIYAVRIGLNGFHGVTTAGGNIVRTKFPDYSTPGAVKTGEAYLENVAVALKTTKAAAVLRGVKVRPGGGA